MAQRLAAREPARAEEQRRRQQELKEPHRKRLDLLRKKGDGAWAEVEKDIAARRGKSYDKALELVLDPHALAKEKGYLEGFFGRQDTIRPVIAAKKAFIRRLDANSSVLRR